MKKLALSSIFVLFFFSTLTIYSQNAVLTQNTQHGIVNQEQCNSALIHKKMLEDDPEYKARVADNEALIQKIIQSKSYRSGTYTVPVVVHVLHLGEAVGTGTNISDAQINSAIANLNTCYAGTAPYSQNIGIQFQLAQRKYDCSSTTGIVRINASGTSDYSTNGITTANEVTVKGLSRWPNSEYYNIWIVSEINGNNGGAGTQGYAYYPGATSTKDGAVILYNSFGYDPTGALGYNLKNYTNRNVTALHELGHAFNLYHTFEGDDANSDGVADQCPTNTTCSSQGDLCCDTEAHKRDDGDCGATGTTCSGQNIASIVNNIMAYSSDVCQTVFTADQKARMLATITGPRLSLTVSPGLVALSGSAPSVGKSCSPQTSNLSNGFGMGVFGLKIGSTEYSSSGAVADGGFRNHWCSNFNLTTNTSYSITVKNGTLNNEKVKVYIDYNNDGDFDDAGENVFNGNTAGLSHSGNFTTAAAPVTGQALWLRVVSDFSGNTITGPCYAPQYGQVEDFSIIFPASGASELVASQCGQTFSDLTGYFYCKHVPNAQDYEFEFTNSGLGYSYTITKGKAVPDVYKSHVQGLIFGNTYNVRVRAKIAGSWGSYGNTCTITLSGSIPTTQMAASQCGLSVSDLTGSFYCNQVLGAQDYEWEFTNSGLGYSYTTNRGIGVPDIAKFYILGLQYGQTYNVRVKAKVGGVWGSYGSPCTITISGSIPTTQVATSQCGQAMNLSGLFYCNGVAGAQDYQWNFVNTGLGYSQTVTRGFPAPNISKTWIPGLQNGVTYDVQVKAKIGGVWGSYGAICQITINTSLIAPYSSPYKSFEAAETQNSLIVFPNPSDDNGFNVSYKVTDLESSIAIIEVYDMMGRKVIQRQVNNIVGINEIKLNTDGNLVTGTYVLVIINGNNIEKKNIVVK